MSQGLAKVADALFRINTSIFVGDGPRLSQIRAHCGSVNRLHSPPQSNALDVATLAADFSRWVKPDFLPDALISHGIAGKTP